MLTLLFIICLIAFIVKAGGFALEATWGITKFLVGVVFFPIVLVIMVVAGLAAIALPVLLIAGLVLMLAANEQECC